MPNRKSLPHEPAFIAKVLDDIDKGMKPAEAGKIHKVDHRQIGRWLRDRGTPSAKSIAHRSSKPKASANGHAAMIIDGDTAIIRIPLGPIVDAVSQALLDKLGRPAVLKR